MEQQQEDKPKSEEQAEISAYCLTCKSKQPIKDPKIVRTQNKHPRLSGTCSKCEKKVSSFISGSKVPVESERS